MGDMGEMFNDWKDMKKEKKKSNLEYSTSLLKEKGVNFETKNNGIHLVIESENGKIDYYPSTGLFIYRESKKKGRGVFNLLKKLGR